MVRAYQKTAVDRLCKFIEKYTLLWTVVYLSLLLRTLSHFSLFFEFSVLSNGV